MISESDDETDYVDIAVVRDEVAAARKLCRQHGWPLIDVTRRSIEESAATLMTYLSRHNTGADSKENSSQLL